MARAPAAKPDPYADPTNPAPPKVDMTIHLSWTALVVTDPQIDFLSPKGKAWDAFKQNITELETVTNLGRLFHAAKAAKIPIVISPHYYYPHDHK